MWASHYADPSMGCWIHLFCSMYMCCHIWVDTYLPLFGFKYFLIFIYFLATNPLTHVHQA